MTTQAMKEHMNKVAQLPCLTCGAEPVEIHHIREGQGMAQRASNWLGCPCAHLAIAEVKASTAINQ